MSRLEFAVGQIKAAHAYSWRLLEQTPDDLWFEMPSPAVSHVAWQVGHLALAEYRLGLERIRGERPGDDRLVTQPFAALFGRNSTPGPDRAAYPSPVDLRRTLEEVHRQVLLEVAALADCDLDGPTPGTHPEFSTRLGALCWCARHEMLHAGQIGLLRRLLGCDPLW